MTIKPVGDVFNEQTLDDNFTYIDQRLNEASEVPTLAFYGPIVIDRVTNKVTLPNFLVIQRGFANQEVKAADFGLTFFQFDLPTTSQVETILFEPDRLRANPMQNPFVRYTGETVPTYNPRNIEVMTLGPNGHLSSQYWVRDKGTDALGNMGLWCSSSGTTGYLNFDFTAGKLFIPSGFLLYGKTYYTPSPALHTASTKSGYTYELPLPQLAGINGLWYNIETNQFVTYNYTTMGAVNLQNCVLLATWYNKSPVNGVVNAPFQVLSNGQPQGVKQYNRYGIFLTGTGLMNFDFTNKKVSIPTNSFIVMDDRFYDLRNLTTHPVISGNYEVPMSAQTTGGIQWLAYDRNAAKFVCFAYPERATYFAGDLLLLATWYNTVPKVNAGFKFLINGAEDGAYTPPRFDETVHRLLLPPKMYFVEGKPLPIYKQSLLSTHANLDLLKTAVINVDPSGTPAYEYFYEDKLLDPAKLSSSFKIAMKQQTNPDYNFHGDIHKVTVAADANRGREITVLCIGDSVMNRNLPPGLQTRLAGYEVTATMIGTIDNKGALGEGREGWEFDNFIGRDNTHMSGTRLEPGPATGLYRNPFLKLADATDYAEHPDWCFRSTGVETEVSYADAVDKSGNFYIFDVNHYLNAYGLQAPDVVIIALSTNDITQNRPTAVANARFALRIMIAQIKKALPTCKIGVVPSAAWGNTNSGNTNWATASTWIEHCMTDIKAMQATYSDLFIVPVWCHMNRDFSWLYNNTVDLSPINPSKKSQITDSIHLSETGKAEYLNALTAFVMNVI